MHDDEDDVDGELNKDKKPYIVGKPNPYVIDLIARENDIKDRSKMIMIGDRPDTDILLGSNAGIDKCLVLTGVV